MKIKRIFATDMRQAIRQVRDEHGPDAVILSSKSVEGGVEVISAIDFDQQAMEQRLAEETTAVPPMRHRHPAGEESPDFRHVLGQVGGARPSGARGGFSVRVDDEIDLEPERNVGTATAFADQRGARRDTVSRKPGEKLTHGDRESVERRVASRSLADVEWSQEPALLEMRSELKTLRSLFENQLSLMDWQQTGRRHPVRAFVLRQLSELGFGPDVCRKVADRVAENVTPDIAFRQALATITRHLPVEQEDSIDEGGVIAVVGPTGVGKTTTVAKLAARFALRHGRQHVALVSTDNFRIGAQDQLRNFARILGVAVHTADDGADLERILEELADRRLVLIDTAGMSQRDLRLAEQFKALHEARNRIRSFLVMSAGTQLTTLNETARAYRKIGLAGCIVTKVDEASSLGPVLTVMMRQRLPAVFLGVGQRVPEDLQPARSDRLVQQAVSIIRDAGAGLEDEQLAMVFGGC